MSHLSYQNIPQTVGCPCQTASSWSGAPAHLRGGRREHCPENQKRNIVVIHKADPANDETFQRFLEFIYHLTDGYYLRSVRYKRCLKCRKSAGMCCLTKYVQVWLKDSQKPEFNKSGWSAQGQTKHIHCNQHAVDGLESAFPLWDIWPWLRPQWWCSLEGCA